MNNRDDWQTRNIHSVYTHCFECGTWGVNTPDNSECGDCSSADTIKYYDEKTVQAELNRVREEGARAGLQEGMEGVIGLILEELDIAEQDKEMAENPDDPKIRIAYLRDKLLRISLAEKEL